MEPKIAASQLWEYKGKEYRIVDVHTDTNFLKVKDTNDSNWYPAIIYTPTLEADGDDVKEDIPYYIRRADDFTSKFKFVSEI